MLRDESTSRKYVAEAGKLPAPSGAVQRAAVARRSAREGTDRDLSRRMRRTLVALALACAWSPAACAQSADGRADAERPVRAVDLGRGASAELRGDALAARADSLIDAGRPWRATLLLAPALKTPATASPSVRLVGARAAARWQGWDEVARLLGDAPWLDTALDGEGHELLVRGALERNRPAVDDARRALAAARTDAERAVRGVLLARAFDQADTRDSAAAWYAGAASSLPAAADWLRLRAAGAVGDSARRAALLRSVASAPARARVPWTDAQARERFRDFAGAARAYRALGAELSALRAESRTVGADTAGFVARAVAFLGRGPRAADARAALELLQPFDSALARDQELVVARAATDAGASARAVAGFRRALAAGALEPRDRFTYASALAGAGRSADAIRTYAALAADPRYGPLAAYQRARVLLRSGNGAGARTALRQVAARYPAVRAASAPALLLLADLQVDDGDLAGAARSLAELVRRHPDASEAPLASFRAGLLAWRNDARDAARRFDALARRYPNDEEAAAARYWAARAYARLGQRAAAESRWRAIVASDAASYYGVLSARRLEMKPWRAPAGADTVAHVATVDSIAARVRALELLGMDVEAGFELDALAARGGATPAEAAPVAQALSRLGEPSRALALATRTLARGADSSRALYRLAYPVLHEDALLENARAHDLDPALVAGLIRQESWWNPDAVSPAGARGLMQLMPSVGASIAKGRRYPVWSPSLLFEPDVSIELGTLHLASSFRAGEPVAQALAAYNAGASRVRRWVQRPGASDPELFTEWIPYRETRDYVRIVTANAGRYAALGVPTR
jgi:soluble lytic murein transglycosylase